MSSTLSSEEMLNAGLTPQGTPLLSAKEISDAKNYIRESGHFIQSMEAFIIQGGREKLSTEFSILGLDGENNWEIHNDPNMAFELLMLKLEHANESGLEVKFKIWLDRSSLQ
jgi:hypothetical protein